MDFVKVRRVISPTRGHATDAGIDFFIPEDLDIKEMKKLNGNGPLSYLCDAHNKVYQIILKPGERTLIPSGIYVKVLPGHALIAFNKSGIASKTGVVIGSCVVDEGYEGEVHLSLINTSTLTCRLNANAKIAQFIMMPINQLPTQEVFEPISEFYNDTESTRGDGGFGSTDYK